MPRSVGKEIGEALLDDLKVYYDDDPDPETAGQGLALAPLISQVLGQDEWLHWMMSPAEQAALVYLLEHLQPKVGIEIGTRFGGSLQIISKCCGRVYSLDTDPDVPRRLEGRFPNVEFIIGPSDKTLPPLIDRLQRDRSELGFVLVDGDHSAAGVRRDINHLLRFVPIVPMFIVMHDSFNPQCREGLRSADWAGNVYVHAVELDFVPGTVNPTPACRGQLWGGLALGYLKPYERQGRFEVTGRAELTFQNVVATSPHKSLKHRIRGFIDRVGGVFLRERVGTEE
jgi:hypothetical protein